MTIATRVLLKPYAQNRGFTILELLVAMVIGMLLVGGIGSLFLSTSRSNNFQERIARLQENGRFAAQRIEQDLRSAGNGNCSNVSGSSHFGARVAMWSRSVMEVYAPNLNWPDTANMRSVNPTSGVAATALATQPYGLSARFFMQGYTCAAATCNPVVPATIPGMGLAPGMRVPASDVLTVRYLRGTGWPITNSVNCTSIGQITIQPEPLDDPLNFVPGDLALIGTCSRPAVLPIAAASGTALTLAPWLGSSVQPSCKANRGADTRVFNFTRDFVTITYYLAFRLDDSPDAPPNNGAQRLIPVLIRRENGVEQELVRGVDRLVFSYGVQDRMGETRFLNATQVTNRVDGSGGSILCPFKALGTPPEPNDRAFQEPGCLWRSVRRVEARLLVNSVDDSYALDPVGLSYRFNDQQVLPTAATPLPSGIAHGNMPRREFIASAAVRSAIQ